MNMLNFKFSVCVLLFGDNIHLAKRCLESLVGSKDYEDYVADFRIGLNNVTGEVHRYAMGWAEHVACNAGIPVLFYRPVWGLDEPPLKYPVMRQMFRDTVALADNVMWFDDDSYIDEDSAWWGTTARIAKQWLCIGQVVRRQMNQNQWQWIQTQRWCRYLLPKQDNFVFPQGAWWSMRSSLLLQYDYPFPELRHCGGDAMLGELCRHQSINIHPWRKGVRINADTLGRDSKAERRGYREDILAWRYQGEPLPTNHQYFTMNRWVVHP